MLMQAIARLPQGAVVLPGFDFEMPTAVWQDLDDETMAEIRRAEADMAAGRTTSLDEVRAEMRASGRLRE